MSYFIDEDEVKRALLLIRDLRMKAVVRNINPLATRIALKMALYIDDIMAKQKLSMKQEASLDEYARALAAKSKNGEIQGWL